MSPVRVTAGGLVTSLGGDFETCCAAIRAGIRHVTTANIFDRPSGAFIDAGQVALHQWWESHEVLPDIVAPALGQCFEAAAPLPASAIPVFLGLPGRDRRGRPPGVDAELLNAIAQRLNTSFHPGSRVVFGSQAAACMAMREIRRLAANAAAGSFIIAAVDSLVRTATVHAYLEQSRILTPINSNGFSPGEAGAAVLVESHPDKPGLEILGVGLAVEPATIDSDQPLRGEGLTDAVRQALADASLTMADVAYRITDLNGERYKFKEATFAFGRLLKQRVPQGIDLWHPIEYVGDIGSAIGPLTLGLALHAGLYGYAPGDVVLLHFSNDGGERGAIVARFASRI